MRLVERFWKKGPSRATLVSQIGKLKARNERLGKQLAVVHLSAGMRNRMLARRVRELEARLGEERSVDETVREWRAVIREARNEAGRLGHTEIMPEHLLLGILRDKNSTAYLMLGDFGVDPADLKRVAEESAGVGTPPTAGVFPHTDDTKKVLEQARIMAGRRGHKGDDQLRSEFLLTALVACRTNARKCLAAVNVEPKHMLTMQMNYGMV